MAFYYLPPVTPLYINGVLHCRATGPRGQVHAGTTIYTTALHHGDCVRELDAGCLALRARTT